MITTITARACQRVAVTRAMSIALLQASVLALEQAGTRLVALLAVVALVAHALVVLARAVAVAAHLHAVHLHNSRTASLTCFSAVTVRALAHERFHAGTTIGTWDAGAMTRTLDGCAVVVELRARALGITVLSMIARKAFTLRLRTIQRALALIRALNHFFDDIIKVGAGTGVRAVVSGSIRVALTSQVRAVLFTNTMIGALNHIPLALAFTFIKAGTSLVARRPVIAMVNENTHHLPGGAITSATGLYRWSGIHLVIQIPKRPLVH